MMKLILFLSLITLFPLASCQREKMNSKNLTAVNVKRDLSTTSAEPEVSSELPGKKEATGSQTPPPASPATGTTRLDLSKEKLPVKETTRPATKSYHIIAASHPREELAKETLDRLKAAGFPDTQIIMKDNRYRVSIANSPDQKEASAKRKELATKLGQEDLWIMLY